MANASSSPEDSYQFHPPQQRAVWQQFGQRIRAIWHSHPTGTSEMSGLDIALAVPDFVYGVYSWAEQRTRWWRVLDGVVIEEQS